MIQVKANLQPKPGGGMGKPALGWWVPDDLWAASPADRRLPEDGPAESFCGV